MPKKEKHERMIEDEFVSMDIAKMRKKGTGALTGEDMKEGERYRDARIQIRTFKDDKEKFFAWCETNDLIPSRVLEYIIKSLPKVDNFKRIVTEWLYEVLENADLSGKPSPDKDLRRASAEVVNRWIIDRTILLTLAFGPAYYPDLLERCQVELDNHNFGFDPDLFDDQLVYLELWGPVHYDEINGSRLYRITSSEDKQ